MGLMLSKSWLPELCRNGIVNEARACANGLNPHGMDAVSRTWWLRDVACPCEAKFG